jgi:hypothetical protein
LLIVRANLPLSRRDVKKVVARGAPKFLPEYYPFRFVINSDFREWKDPGENGARTENYGGKRHDWHWRDAGFKDIGGRAARSFDGIIQLRNPEDIRQTSAGWA